MSILIIELVIVLPPGACSEEERKLKEAKDEYNQELDRKKTLEGKANNFATISGTVATLLFGLGQFLIGKLIDLHNEFLFYVVTSLLLIGGALSVVAIFLSVKGFRISLYSYVREGKKTDEPSILESSADAVELSRVDSIELYKNIMKQNVDDNNKRAVCIRWAQWFFVFSMIMPAFILSVILFSGLPNAGPTLVWEAIDAINRGSLTSQGHATGLANVPTHVFLTAGGGEEGE